MVIEQYPHHLYKRANAEATIQSNGDWVANETEWVLVGKCREESNGKGQEIMTSDFKPYKFSSLIQCPFGTPRIAEGVSVMVKDEKGVVLIEGECKKFDDGHLHCRIWV